MGLVEEGEQHVLPDDGEDARVRSAMAMTCQLSSSAMARMLPKITAFRFTATGLSEMMTRPSANIDVKMRPMTASSFSMVSQRTAAMPKAATSPEVKAPTA
jgi:hypothetical protein